MDPIGILLMGGSFLSFLVFVFLEVRSRKDEKPQVVAPIQQNPPENSPEPPLPKPALPKPPVTPQTRKPIPSREDIKPTPVQSLSTKPQVELPPKAPNVPPIQIDQKKTPSWTTTFPSLSTHKKEYDQKISEPSSDLPKAVKNQSPLPEFGGMCNNCGDKPKVPGNDGFCTDCSELN